MLDAVAHSVPSPRHRQFLPFRGSRAVAKGELTRNMLRGRAWRRLLPDIYIPADMEPDYRIWCEAAALLLPDGAAIARRSAAFLWGVDLLPHDGRGHPVVTVVCPRQRRLSRHPRLDIRYSTLNATDITMFAEVPLTTPLRTAFDLGRQPPRTDAVIALDALLHRRLVGLPALTELARARRGWPGVPLLREACALAEPLSESPMETRLRLLLVEHGLPRPVAQHRVHDDNGRFIARVDLAYPGVRLALEYEGDHHRARRTFQRDIARLNELRAAGWTVLRFTADDVLRHPGRIVRQIVAVLQSRKDRP